MLKCSNLTRKRCKKTTRYLFNCENKYSTNELVINWLILLFILLILITSVLFTIYSYDGTISSISSMAKTIPKNAAISSLIAFLALCSLIVTMILKFVSIRNRKIKNKGDK